MVLHLNMTSIRLQVYCQIKAQGNSMFFLLNKTYNYDYIVSGADLNEKKQLHFLFLHGRTANKSNDNNKDLSTTIKKSNLICRALL